MRDLIWHDKDNPIKAAEALRMGILRDGMICVEDVDAERIALWLEELVALRRLAFPSQDTHK